MASRHDDTHCLTPRAAERREKIVGTARRLFMENGFHATGVAQIAKESGIAVGQIYRDFACKEAIIEALVKADTAQFLANDALKAGIDAGDAVAVWQWIEGFLNKQRIPTSVLIMEIVAEAIRNEKIHEIFEANRRDVSDALLDALDMLAPGPDLAERRATLVDLIMVLSLGILQNALLGRVQAVERFKPIALQLVKDELRKLGAPESYFLSAQD